MNVLNKFLYHSCDLELKKICSVCVRARFAEVKKKWKSHNYAKIPLFNGTIAQNYIDISKKELVFEMRWWFRSGRDQIYHKAIRGLMDFPMPR